MSGILSKCAAALLVACAVLTLASQPALAQGIPEPPSPGGMGDLLANPGKWLTTEFNALLVNVGRDTTNNAVEFMTWLLGNGNVINRTPPNLSYDSDVVRQLWGTLRFIGNAALAVVAVLGGINLMIQPHLRAPYHGTLELIPRVLLGAVLVNSSLDWGRFVIDANNALCQALGPGSIPALKAAAQPSGGAVLLNMIAIVIYAVMGFLLFIQMLMRLALVDALLILAPLALLCWVLPQTYGWARTWFTTFFAAVFVQFVQVVILQLGANLIDHLPGEMPGLSEGAVSDWRTWLVTLLLGVAVLQLTRQIPRLMPWYPLGGPVFAQRASAGRSRTAPVTSSGTGPSGSGTGGTSGTLRRVAGGR